MLKILKAVAVLIGFFLITTQVHADINTVVIPAAGMATRFFPWTKTVAKELLPLGTKAAIEFVAQEAVDAGCSHIVIINNARKQTLMNYFEHAQLNAHFTYIPQNEPRGLGHAVEQARNVVKDDYFAIILPDELCFSKTPGIKQLIDVAQTYKATVIAVMEVPENAVSSYGIISIKKQLTPDLFECDGIVEKPTTEAAPSHLASTGRYVLPTKIFNVLAQTKPGTKNEIQLTDAIATLIKNGERVLAYKIKGVRHDIGVPFGWAKAVAWLSTQNQQYGAAFKEYLKTLVN